MIYESTMCRMGINDAREVHFLISLGYPCKLGLDQRTRLCIKWKAAHGAEVDSIDFRHSYHGRMEWTCNSVQMRDLTNRTVECSSMVARTVCDCDDLFGSRLPWLGKSAWIFACLYIILQVLVGKTKLVCWRCLAHTICWFIVETIHSTIHTPYHLGRQHVQACPSSF